jgi:hypothetical protein
MGLIFYMKKLWKEGGRCNGIKWWVTAKEIIAAAY